MTDLLERFRTGLADRYVLGRELGRGGMATVYLAEDLKHQRRVAVKVLLPELAATLGGERFLQEIRVTAALQHPHILPLYDSGEADGLLYYVMPYVEGESLRDRLQRETQLPVDEALRIVEQVASALACAHRHDVIHRDIKPANILLHAGEAMVADFGIALAVNVAGAQRLTDTGLSIGTPEYMSPEQVAGERTLDARSDVYSLACVAYEMLAGQPPFTGATGKAVLARHVTDPVPAITTVRPGVPHPVAAAITTALAKAPADRFASAEQFAAALRADTPGPGTKSIVVLPFVNRSPDPENEYFSDGLTEELTADLSKISALRVLSHNSAMQLKGTDKDTRTIGRELSVRYVLTGGVRKAGTSVRITAHLADTTDDSEVWTGKYGGKLDDIFEMQENVSQAIVDALQVSLSPTEEKQLGARIIENPRAYDSYLRARRDIFRASRDSIEQAIRLLQDAIDIEGDNSLLVATIGYAYVMYLRYRWADDENWVRSEVARCLEKLRTLAPESPQEHFARGMIAFYRCDLHQAIHQLEQSFIGDRNRPETVNWLLNAYLFVGREKSSVAHLIDHLLAIDPLTPWHATLGSAFDAFEGRTRLALNAATRALTMATSGLWEIWARGYYLALDGQNDAAVTEAERLRQLAPEFPWAHQLCALTRALSGDVEKARSFITDQLIATAPDDNHASLHLAEIYAVLRDREDAIAWLKNAIALGFVHYPFFSHHNPFFDGLHGDPEFVELMEQAKAEWEHFGSLPIPAVDG